MEKVVRGARYAVAGALFLLPLIGVPLALLVVSGEARQLVNRYRGGRRHQAEERRS
ncbi:MAG: hypothetical protein QY311_01320 [Candidatus Paceibacterota bacterium]|nr:MAG: hypothetical protein QY311_01320 [Candidatus Paceibacterota bacterium]